MYVTDNYQPQVPYNGNNPAGYAANGYINPAGNNPLSNQVNGAPVQNQVQNQAPQSVNTAPAQPYCYQPQINVPPNANGVNIQIFNPSVGTPGSQSSSSVNAPNYYCYPPNYYTDKIGGAPQSPNNTGVNQANGQNRTTENSNTQNNTQNNTSGTGALSGQNGTANQNAVDDGQKKTEKKHIVVLNDNYIKNLETMLSSRDKADRVNAAKQVFERLDEDPSRKDDKALTALINKMLQDPAQEVRLLALSALEGRICNGDQLTVQLLQQMRTNPKDYGYDANDASRILLDMSAQRADKEVPIDPDKQTKVKKDDKKDEKDNKDKSQIKANNQ